MTHRSASQCVFATHPSAPVIASNQQGESPCQSVLDFVTESNCVAARRGGEQLEVND